MKHKKTKKSNLLRCFQPLLCMLLTKHRVFSFPASSLEPQDKQDPTSVRWLSTSAFFHHNCLVCCSAGRAPPALPSASHPSLCYIYFFQHIFITPLFLPPPSPNSFKMGVSLELCLTLLITVYFSKGDASSWLPSLQWENAFTPIPLTWHFFLAAFLFKGTIFH